MQKGILDAHLLQGEAVMVHVAANVQHLVHVR